MVSFNQKGLKDTVNICEPFYFMRKTKAKAIRKIANQLPQLMTTKIEVKTVTGRALIKSGIEKLGDKEVCEKSNYTQKRKVSTPINHYRKMKKFYQRYGAPGVNAYAKEVLRVHEQSKTAA